MLLYYLLLYYTLLYSIIHHFSLFYTLLLLFLPPQYLLFNFYYFYYLIFTIFISNFSNFSNISTLLIIPLCKTYIYYLPYYSFDLPYLYLPLLTQLYLLPFYYCHSLILSFFTNQDLLPRLKLNSNYENN